MVKGGKDSLYEDLKRQIVTMELDPDADLDGRRCATATGSRGRRCARYSDG